MLWKRRVTTLSLPLLLGLEDCVDCCLLDLRDLLGNRGPVVIFLRWRSGLSRRRRVPVSLRVGSAPDLAEVLEELVPLFRQSRGILQDPLTGAFVVGTSKVAAAGSKRLDFHSIVPLDPFNVSLRVLRLVRAGLGAVCLSCAA